MLPSWYSVCIPSRIFFAIAAYFSWFSYIYILICVGFIISFVYERKLVKLVHAFSWGFSYFGGIASFILIIIDTAVSVSIAINTTPIPRDPVPTLNPVPLQEMPTDAVATKIIETT